MENKNETDLEYISKLFGISIENAQKYIDSGLNISYIRYGLNKKIESSVTIIKDKYTKKINNLIKDEFKQ